MPTTCCRGIKHWNEKLEALKVIFDVKTKPALFANFVKPENLDAVLESSRKWDKHSPRNMEVFADLADEMGCKNVSGRAIVENDFTQFFKMLSTEKQNSLRYAVADGRLQLDDNIKTSIGGWWEHTQDLSDIIIRATRTNNDLSINDGVISGIIDTSHYYSTPESAKWWNKLISTEAYPTYDCCKDGLQLLVKHQSWQKVLSEISPRNAVMLAGGGASSKDKVILNNLLDQPTIDGHQVTMILEDISPYMLLQSARELVRFKESHKKRERIELKFVHANILNSDEFLHPVFRRNGSTVFAITGGTIGNISERAFFKSLNTIAIKDDLLIISAGIIDGIDPQNLKTRLKKKYDHTDMRCFVKQGVLAVIAECQRTTSFSAAWKRIKVCIAPNDGLSDVKDSWNVTLILPTHDRDITLLRSTRYSKASMVQFASEFGWDSVCVVPSNLDKNFVQFAFRKRVA